MPGRCILVGFLLALLAMQTVVARPNFNSEARQSDVLRRIRSPVTGSSNRYEAILNQEIKGMGTVHLEYNATLSNFSKILDNMEFITQVRCFKNKLVLNISTEKNASFVAKDFIEQRSIVHGGSEWGCKDKFGREKPFYFDVNSTHVEARTVILRGSHCSPFALFKRLKWSLTITPPAENERRSMPTAAADGLEGASTRIGGTWQSTFNPPPLTISDDLVQLAKAELTVQGKDVKAELGLDASAVASASFGISPVTFHWDIDVGTKDPCSCHWYAAWCCVPIVPYISSTTIWVQLTPAFSIDVDLELGGGSLAASFEIYPDHPIPELGVGFNVGVVSFDLGVLVGIDGKVEFEVSAPMSYTAGIAISQPMQYGFSYTGSAHGIQQLGARSVVPTSTGQLPDSINADLTLNVIPTLSFGLEGSFLSEGESLKLEVELDFYVTLAFAAGLPTLPLLSSSELASYPFLGQKSVCIQPHHFEFSIAVGLDLDVDFVAAGAVWGYNLPLFDVTVFNIPVYLVCFSPQCQPGNFGTSSGTVPKAS